MPGYPQFSPVDANGNVIGTSALATGDALAAGTVPVEVVGLWNGTTIDRAKGSNGALNVGLQGAFPLYVESAVVNGARLTTGNIAGGSMTNQLQWMFVSVNVTAFTGGTNIVYSLQQADANGNFVTIGSTTTITATGTYGLSVGPGMTWANMLNAGNGNWRVSWVVTGSFSAVTSQIGVSAR